jgi:hypothetical protein
MEQIGLATERVLQELRRRMAKAKKETTDELKPPRPGNDNSVAIKQPRSVEARVKRRE